MSYVFRPTPTVMMCYRAQTAQMLDSLLLSVTRQRYRKIDDGMAWSLGSYLLYPISKSLIWNRLMKIRMKMSSSILF